ncbi:MULTISPECIES: hypothetical protein [unclassified Caballeronia]|uniref:hypothetical protein n=1 Tax=unclassified Caballeronia TaxID=2646786 RepID=UPI002858FC8F|nr:MULTISPECIES: hypothetical protein [unclassified Caballeronia]MDR5754236.1 hypothetical protein [Caballeronia sp. LZ024]MDR5840614.1 hypothetical protein [Caballeronia sp. LZ031]
MAAKHPPYSVVLTYAEDRQMLTARTVETARLADLMATRLEMPILLDEFEFKLDDEFARRLGVAVLNLIALGQPEIKQYMTVTQAPLPRDE